MKDADALMERLSELPPAPSMQSRRQWTKIHLLSSHWLILGFVGNRTKCRSSKSKVYIYIYVYIIIVDVLMLLASLNSGFFLSSGWLPIC